MAVNYGRQKRKEQGSSLDDYSTPDELIKQINEVRAFYRQHYDSDIVFEYDCGYSDVRHLYAYYWRDETDAEMAERIKNEERWDKHAKERDAREYARLKAQFEGKT